MLEFCDPGKRRHKEEPRHRKVLGVILFTSKFFLVAHVQFVAAMPIRHPNRHENRPPRMMNVAPIKIDGVGISAKNTTLAIVR